MTVRTAQGVNGQQVILAAWCPGCHEWAMPMERTGACGWCDTIILTRGGKARFSRRGGVPRLIDIPHGTQNGYQHHRCRCVACTNAHRLFNAFHVAKRKAREAA